MTAKRRPRASGYVTAFAPVIPLEEVAALLGVTRQRAQQIEQAALNKLRRALEARGLRLDDVRP